MKMRLDIETELFFFNWSHRLLKKDFDFQNTLNKTTSLVEYT